MATKKAPKKPKAEKPAPDVQEVENVVPAPIPAAPRPSTDGFPHELASKEEPQHERAVLPPMPSDVDPFNFNADQTGLDRDIAAQKAVSAGKYTPGVEPTLEPGQRVYEAPDGVLFAGPKNEDQFLDPRNGRMIRPRR